MTRVLLADDHAVVRNGLKETINGLPGFTVVAEASKGTEVLSKVQKANVDVVIMDISMPGRNGMEVLDDLKRLHPKVCVLIFSMHEEDEYALRAFRSGAAGYLTKASPLAEVSKALQVISKRGKYVSASLAPKLLVHVATPGAAPLRDQLSNREEQIMRLIAAGRSLTSIGTELCISAKTVTSYRGRIFDNMGFKTNADLFRYCLSSRTDFAGQRRAKDRTHP